MSQPTTLTQTFDTSLVDVTRSFSSTDTNTSGSSAKENTVPDDQTPRIEQRAASPYRTLSTAEMYTYWAPTYDTDGNVLQAADDIQLCSMLPEFIQLVIAHESFSQNPGPLKILDLGCGTGRNTLKLLQADWHGHDVAIVGWDAGEAMLSVAQDKLSHLPHARRNRVGFECIDFANPDVVPAWALQYFDAVISTLVLEHIPTTAFFDTLSNVLRPGGYALITEMHPDMGARSQAGFKTEFGERFKAISYVRPISEIVEASLHNGFKLANDVREMECEEAMIEGGIVNGVRVGKGRVTERARKWIGTKIWYGYVLRKK